MSAIGLGAEVPPKVPVVATGRARVLHLEDSRLALASLDRIAALPADTLLPGHGDPWHGSLSDAVARAREAGPS